ncbi:HU family DNA-binding protein [Bacteroides sp. OttesenSCG-928-M17]|nr:HU family DNA-binding protein [Bacteroides sp. OttesenSCG-928-M17]
MSLKFVVAKKVFGFDDTKTEKYVVKQVLIGRVEFKRLCLQVSQICGAHRGVVQQVLAGVVDAMVNTLESGQSVQLGEFGTFRPAIRVKSSETAEGATASTVYRKRILFTPGEALKGMIGKVGLQQYKMPDTDYTDGGKNSNRPDNNPGNNPEKENPGEDNGGNGGGTDPAA